MQPDWPTLLVLSTSQVLNLLWDVVSLTVVQQQYLHIREAFQEPDELVQIKNVEECPPQKAISKHLATAVTELNEYKTPLTFSQRTVVVHDNTCPVHE